MNLIVNEYLSAKVLPYFVIIYHINSFVLLLLLVVALASLFSVCLFVFLFVFQLVDFSFCFILYLCCKLISI